MKSFDSHGGGVGGEEFPEPFGWLADDAQVAWAAGLVLAWTSWTDRDDFCLLKSWMCTFDKYYLYDILNAYLTNVYTK